jgi:Flp pilus assembly pilin Flp
MNMTAVSTRRYGYGSMMGLLVAALAVLIVAVLVVGMPQVQPNLHAVLRHGDEALAIRRCLENKGPQQVWKKFGSERFILVCKLDDGRLGIQIVQKVKEKWEEITAFIPENGTPTQVRAYLMKYATKWNGALPK